MKEFFIKKLCGHRSYVNFRILMKLPRLSLRWKIRRFSICLVEPEIDNCIIGCPVRIFDYVRCRNDARMAVVGAFDLMDNEKGRSGIRKVLAFSICHEQDAFSDVVVDEHGFFPNGNHSDTVPVIVTICRPRARQKRKTIMHVDFMVIYSHATPRLLRCRANRTQNSNRYHYQALGQADCLWAAL